jgi:hypothetical protein
MVRQLFKRAVERAPEGMPFFIFIDINAPLDAAVDERWRSDVQQWMSRLRVPTSEEPDVFNALYVTNFSPHYDGDDISRWGSWLAALALHVREPLEHDIGPGLQRALDTYGRVPALAEHGTLLGVGQSDCAKSGSPGLVGSEPDTPQGDTGLRRRAGVRFVSVSEPVKEKDPANPYSPSCFPRISFMISSVPPPIGPRRVSRAARSTSYSFM